MSKTFLLMVKKTVAGIVFSSILPTFFKISSFEFNRRNSHRFGTTWGWVNSFFGWTIPLMQSACILSLTLLSYLVLHVSVDHRFRQRSCGQREAERVSHRSNLVHLHPSDGTLSPTLTLTLLIRDGEEAKIKQDTSDTQRIASMTFTPSRVAVSRCRLCYILHRYVLHLLFRWPSSLWWERWYLDPCQPPQYRRGLHSGLHINKWTDIETKDVCGDLLVKKKYTYF